MLPRPAPPAERSAALARLLAHLPSSERDARRHGILDSLASGAIDSDGLLVLPSGAAIMASPVAGAGGILWPPSPCSDHEASLLVEAAVAWLRSRGARVAQSLAEPALAGRGLHLLANGFALATTLLNLFHPLFLTGEMMREGVPLRLDPYDPRRPRLFHDTLEATYEGSLDCPELNGVRTVEEVIEGHLAQGRFDPAAWWLVHHRDEPAGVVIQCDHDATEERELAYIGIVPACRRLGLGRELMVRAIGETRAAGMSKLVLSVDERNRPAWALYDALGFEEASRHHVYLRVL
ncbi:MAG: GNAT family N-acetyltransferase [Gemmataceae bacterium]|nr:GNAT family N-acetyltransferase [Gemmataceae bacterium]